MVNPSLKDHEWVKKTLKKHPKGLSAKDLVAISAEEKELGMRIKEMNPPSREKIYKILKDYSGKDWDYELGGGRNKNSIIKLKGDTSLSGLGRTVKDLLISEKIRDLDTLYQKKTKRLPLKEIIELFMIRDAMLAYPVNVFYNDTRHSSDKDILFNSALSVSKDQIKKIKKIETVQRQLNDKFDKTMIYLDKLRNSKLIEVEIFDNRKDNRDISLTRNTLQKMYRL